jgi:glycosyltransferase involved in cell wall biosynthesis
VLEVRDLWPESIVTVGAMRKSVVVRLLERLEAAAYVRADAVVSVTDSFVAHIAERRGARGGIVVIKNGVDLALFKEPADPTEIKRRLGLDGCFVAAYVGTHGLAHGLDTVLDAAERLKSDKRIAFLLVGDGAERARLAEEKERRGLANVFMLGQQPKEFMPDIWAASDASLIHLVRSDLFRKVIPSKMFEAMAMRRPIVLGVEGEARSLLDAAGAGIAVTPESAAELAAAVVRLADDPALARRLGENGRAHVCAHFDRRVLAGSYLKVLEGVAVTRSGYCVESEPLAGDRLSR